MNLSERWTVRLLAMLALLAPLKFGVPVMLQWFMTPPSTAYEWFLAPWPNILGVMLVFAGVIVWASGHRIWMQRRDWFYWLPAMFLVTQVLALPGSVHRQVSLDVVLHIGVCVVLFYAAAWHMRDGASVARVFQGIGWATLLICVVALDQRYGFWSGGFEASAKSLAQIELTSDIDGAVRGRLEVGRVFGTFAGYPNAMAGFLGVMIGPVLAWVLTVSRQWNRTIRRVALFLVVWLVTWCLWLTGSRGGFMALASGAVAGCLCVAFTRDTISNRLKWVVGGGVLVVLVGFVILALSGHLPRGVNSVSARIDYWQGALKIAKDHPLWGTGPGTFGSVYPIYKVALTEETKAVHNDYLQILCEAGFLSFLVYIGLWVWGGRDALRLVKLRNGDAASVALVMFFAAWTVHSMIDFDLFVPGLAWPAFMILGMVQGLKDPVVSERIDEPVCAERVVRVTCGILVAIVIVYGGLLLTANIYYGKTQPLYYEDNRRINLKNTMEFAQRSVRLAPMVAHYGLNAGHIALDNQQYNLAEEYFRHAVNQDKFRTRYRLKLAEALYHQGKLIESLSELENAARLNPTNLSIQRTLQRVRESIRQSEDSLLHSPRNE